MLIRCDNFGVVPGVMTAKELLKLFWDGLAFTRSLCCIRGVSQADVWSAIQVLSVLRR